MSRQFERNHIPIALEAIDVALGFAELLTEIRARLRADVTRWVFIAVDFFAGLPAHW